MTKGFSGAAARSGFSLVELSIVLVILGLLTGGILTGQNLIRAAELRSVVTDIQKYQAAYRSFQGRYFAIPGDMSNATDFWGAAADDGTGSTCHETSTGDQRTCNGTGDSSIGPSAQRWELFRLWQHLANAGMIEGHYTGIHGDGHDMKTVIGENAPASKISPTGWQIRSTDGGAVYLRLGTETTTTLYGAVLPPPEQWNIDKKLDDGLPREGNILAASSDVDCYNGTAGSESYILTGTSPTCSLLIFGF